MISDTVSWLEAAAALVGLLAVIFNLNGLWEAQRDRDARREKRLDGLIALEADHQVYQEGWRLVALGLCLGIDAIRMATSSTFATQPIGDLVSMLFVGVEAALLAKGVGVRRHRLQFNAYLRRQEEQDRIRAITLRRRRDDPAPPEPEDPYG